MQTPSNLESRGQWTARTDTPKRSVFGNYRPATGEGLDGSVASEHAAAAWGAAGSSEQAIELAVARAFLYRFLAKAYEDPNLEGWDWLCAPKTTASVAAAWKLVAPGEPVALPFQVKGFNEFHDAYIAAFGHAARGNCPLNEIEYGDIKADPLFQPHRLADLAAFYRAFGLDVAEDADERHDHLCMELEFMCVLAAKQGYALEHRADGEQLSVCLDAQKKFLREHVGRWTPAFTRRLAAATNEPAIRTLADFTRRFVELECARFGVAPGSGDMALRPVDDSADRMCDSCGLSNLPPGALGST